MNKETNPQAEVHQPEQGVAPEQESCPFCGSSEIVSASILYPFYLYCKNCLSAGPREGSETFGRKWNTRATPPASGDRDAAQLRVREIIETLCNSEWNTIDPNEAEAAIAELMAVASLPSPDALVDECVRRMDAVVDAAVEWRQSDEGWQEDADRLEAAVDSLLELRSSPEKEKE